MFLSKVARFGAGPCLAAVLVCAEPPLPQVERLKSSPVLRHLGPNPMPSPPRTPAEETVAQMYVPPGFRVELVAAEPELHQPVAFAWDERGRIWIAEAYSYPTKRAAGQGLDKIVIFEDGDGDGRFESRKVFAEGLNLVSGFEVGHGGVWVGAAPELLFIADANHDDIPDGSPQVLLDGFGFQDTHECLNSFLWGPDGWLYGIQGVFNLAHIGKPGAPATERKELRAGVWRYHPVSHQFEIFAHGGSNPWGLDYDEHGQFFMTHCRSYWGRGGTTHVIQGGHFWNQANANYAPFIIADPPRDFPGFRNYLLASARYDHGAGGAGAPGSDAIYGGHSHVGTMIYLGDNWPDEFRGRLFTHNLGGHQINQQINRRLGSGFDTTHAGRDQLFCTDPKYVAIDLQYGPDGAVYFIDWYDQQHCHNPNTERWDRGNGRLYRMQWQATWKPAKVDLGHRSDIELAELLVHGNEWFVRMAQRLFQERHLRSIRTPAGPRIDPKARDRVVQMAKSDPLPARRLRGLWAANAIGAFNPELSAKTLTDADEFVRAWTIQIRGDTETKPTVADELIRMAEADPSPVVRRQLASMIQRVPGPVAWPVIEALARRGEDREDRNLPFLLWHGMAPHMTNLDRAFAVAEQTQLPQLADWIYAYAATLGPESLERVVTVLGKSQGETQRRRLAGLWLALESRPGDSMPAAWSGVAPALYASKDPRVRRQAERVAAVFGDTSAFPRLRRTLADVQAGMDERQHAFAVLSRAPDRESLPLFLQLLDEPAFRAAAFQVLARFDSPTVPEALLKRFSEFALAERSAALSTLTSRATFALALLDAVGSGRLKRDQLTAFHIRQLAALDHAEINRRVAANWGRMATSPADKVGQIDRLEKIYNEAPLWAYEARAGREHFLKLCAQCHVIGSDGTRLGPELTGAGKHGIRYYLENIIDPNAVVGTDFQMTVIENRAGEVLSGIVTAETPESVSLRTTVDTTVIAKGEIARRSTGESSLMPEGLLEGLNPREQLELLKFLTSN